MMPVVDAGVGLSQNEFSVDDYLRGIKQFHVLRMVTVQSQQPIESALQELSYFQTQATTRGFGGFPNAIVASVNLLDPAVITKLVEMDVLDNLRSVCHYFAAPSFATTNDDCNRSGWEQSLNILAEKQLSLDLFATHASDAIIVQLAEFQPELNIILNITNVTESDIQNTTQRLTQLAKYNNIYLKVCGTESLTSGAHVALASIIDNALDIFGFERIMFASGVNQHSAEDEFDQLWTQYVNACSSLSAKYRDCLFRTNAIRVYGL